MIWTREEYLSHMTFESSEREMFTELFGPLSMLSAEWREQGAAEDEISLRAFGWDSVKYAYVPFSADARTGIKPRVISDNDRETVSIDAMGRKIRLSKKCAMVGLPFTYPVETPNDWDRVKSWYAYDDARLDMETLKTLKKQRDEGALIILSMPGGFDEPRGLMGEKNLCYAYYDEPEMIHDMTDTFGNLMKQGLERILNEVGVDLLTVHEDMAGISGSMIGPKLIEEFIAPYYKSVWSLAKQGGARVFSQDSDGNKTGVIDAFLDAGINCMYPAEPKAGMDIQKLRREIRNAAGVKGRHRQIRAARNQRGHRPRAGIQNERQSSGRRRHFRPGPPHSQRRAH